MEFEKVYKRLLEGLGSSFDFDFYGDSIEVNKELSDTEIKENGLGMDYTMYDPWTALFKWCMRHRGFILRSDGKVYRKLAKINDDGNYQVHGVDGLVKGYTEDIIQSVVAQIKNI